MLLQRCMANGETLLTLTVQSITHKSEHLANCLQSHALKAHVGDNLPVRWGMGMPDSSATWPDPSRKPPRGARQPQMNTNRRAQMTARIANRAVEVQEETALPASGPRPVSVGFRCPQWSANGREGSWTPHWGQGPGTKKYFPGEVKLMRQRRLWLGMATASVGGAVVPAGGSVGGEGSLAWRARQAARPHLWASVGRPRAGRVAWGVFSPFPRAGANCSNGSVTVPRDLLLSHRDANRRARALQARKRYGWVQGASKAPGSVDAALFALNQSGLVVITPTHPCGAQAERGRPLCLGETAADADRTRAVPFPPKGEAAEDAPESRVFLQNSI
eukprot:gene5554-biopygen23733